MIRYESESVLTTLAKPEGLDLTRVGETIADAEAR